MFLKISNQFKSPNFDNRRKNIKIKYIIIHYTETKDLNDALEILCNPDKKVSSHFVIDLDGGIFRLVDENKKAWHAGVSFWKKDKHLNDVSLGIEIVNDGGKKFTAIQIRSLVSLLQKLVKDFSVNNHNILGHSDVAPERKIDPGIFFPWEKLRLHDFGLPLFNCTDSKRINLSDDRLIVFLTNLKIIGFSQVNLKKLDYETNKLIIDSFHRHFLKEMVGKIPSEKSLKISNLLVSIL